MNTIGSLSTPKSAELPHPLDGVTSKSTDGSVVLKLETGLFELGRNRARDSGAITPHPEDLQSLEEHAHAIARQTYQESFDPSKHAHDKVRDDEYQGQLAERAEVQHSAAHARANLRDAEMALAKTSKAGDKPTPNSWLLAAAIISIDLSVAPTLHDRFFYTLNDDLLVWFASIASAAFVAAILALAILAGRNSVGRHACLFAGIGIGIALGIIRLSTTESLAEVMFAVGLTVFEIAAVLLLEWVARALRDSEEKWVQAKRIEDEATRIREVYADDLAQRTERLDQISKAIRDHLAYVEERSSRNLEVADLETVAVKAVLDGYNAGIRENVGRIRGIRRTQ